MGGWKRGEDIEVETNSAWERDINGESDLKQRVERLKDREKHKEREKKQSGKGWGWVNRKKKR